MPTKISSYLTELGFRQINALGDSIGYNKENAGEFLVVKENNRLYRYESNSVQPIDNLNVLNTSDGGNTRWIAVGGAAMTQTRVNYTFEESSNIIPLGQKVLSKANILYVNIGNTQILSSEYTLNETKDALILPQNFEAGVQTEVVIVIGDFTPESTGLPDQTGQAGKFLTTDGSEASWADITIPENVVSAENYTDAKTWKGTLEEYEALQEYSDNTTYIITDDYTGGSGGTSDYNALKNKPSINGITLEGNKTTTDLLINSLPDQAGNEGKVLTTNGSEASWQTLPSSGLPLFAHIWSDHLLTNTSYLRADTFSWQDGTVYETAYNELVTEKNLVTESSSETIADLNITYYRTPKGYKIVLPNMADTIAQLYEKIGIAWYYILDTENQQFKLPRNSRYESGTTLEIAGDFSAESLPNITGSFGERFHDKSAQMQASGCFRVKSDSIPTTSTNSQPETTPSGWDFDASRSSPIYQNNAKVNTDHITQFLYFYVGNTVQNETTIDVAAITEALNKKADRDLNNLTEDATNAIKLSDITNCITKIPQDIKLELTDGVLTLKAGSKIYIPNGVNMFDEIVIDVDKTLTISVDGTHFVTLNSIQNLAFNPVNRATSGTQSPTSSGYWYDINENKIKYYSGSAFNEYYYSLPLCIVTVSDGVATSIDQVFNGFGYIGSAAFVLPGVEFLSSNGRNTDGSLNNAKFTINSVIVRENPIKGLLAYFRLNPDSLIDMGNNNYYEQEEEPTTAVYSLWYKPSENIMRYVNGIARQWIKTNSIYAITASADSTGRIISFNPKNTFKAIDANSIQKINLLDPNNKLDNPIPVNTTFDTTGYTYTLPFDGYLNIAWNSENTTGSNYVTLPNGASLKQTMANNNVINDIFVLPPLPKGTKLIFKRDSGSGKIMGSALFSIYNIK